MKPSMNSVAETLRRHKVRFRDSDLRRWLDVFAPQSRRKPAANGPQKTSTLAVRRPQVDRNPAAASREKEVSLFSSLGSSLRSSPTNGHAVVEERPKKAPRATKLPFDRDLLDRRQAILKAVWQRVQPIIGRSTTWTDWRKRNARVADSFVAGGYSPEQILSAWDFACQKEHEPVRELSRVQRFLEDLAVYKARKAAEA